MATLVARQAALALVMLAVAGLMAVVPGPRPTQAAQQGRARLGSPAPELGAATGWLNTGGKALRLRDLRGKVVLLDFWTYCCINCMHILPDLEKLEEKYANELVVIGVHTGKFSAEKDLKNIREAVARYHIKHPVCNDPRRALWNAYNCEYWPSFRLIDPDGNLVLALHQEGKLEVLDDAIARLVQMHRARGTLNGRPMRWPLEKIERTSPLYYPGKVLADAAGQRLFIADSSHQRIVITTLEGKLIDVVGTGQVGKRDGRFDEATFDDPQGLALIGDHLYVADRRNCLIRRIDLKDKTVLTVAGTGQQAYLPAAPRGPALRTILNSPWDLCAVDGQIYVAMAGNHQIWLYEPQTGMIAPFSGAGDENIRDGGPTQALFSQPSGLTSDGTTLWVADAEISAVRAVSLPSGNVKTLVGTGLFDFGDVDGQGRRARLQHALAVQFHDGVLYVADTYNNKIKTLNPRTMECRTFLGDRKAGSTDDPPRFDDPGGLSIAGDQLYVADTNNHAIRVVDLKSKKVRTLELVGVEPPASVETVRRPTFPNPSVVRLPAVTVPAEGEWELQVKLRLNPQIKLSPTAPLEYMVEGDQSGAPPTWELIDMLEQPRQEFTVKVPLDKLSGATTLRVSVKMLCCTLGNEALCFPKACVWEVPLKFEAGSTARPLTLESETLQRP
ncbi:MAG TPA: thioredoxin-like domain-containing protein [Gemmatales bacterium]|nr:thioredoxin-like domain-containing protein [Gemmatales bacterium]HMP59907.1 thioredoxin-like domain-containing protein [Gemmatales bacterium]